MTKRDYFKGKRIAVVGLGIHGEMIEDVKFLIKAGALVSIYDLKSEARLKTSLVYLRSVGLANYVCGSVPADDLLDMDLIILSHEYPRDSSFLRKIATEQKKIPVEYPETLFFKLAPPITLVGVIGSCGKSTVVSMLAPMLESACEADPNQKFFVLDPESSGGILAHLKTIKNGDIVLLRMIEPIVKELSEMRVSPHVAVFTTVPSKESYYQSPFEILSYQTYNNFIVANDDVVDATHALGFQPKAKMLRTKGSLIPADWAVNGSGLHDRDNAALAFQTARLFKVGDEEALRALERWKPIKGRLELVKKVRNVEYYNDTGSTGALATETGIQALSKDRNLLLIFGGARPLDDRDAGKNSDYRDLYAVLPQYARAVILLPGSGTMKERRNIEALDHVAVFSAPSIEEAVRMASEHARKGDRVLFSPGFEAYGFDFSRKNRGERFVRAVRGL